MGKTKPKSSEKETEDEREGQKCESVSVESSNLTVNSTSENVVNSSESILAAQTLISTKPSDDLKPFFQQMTSQMSDVNANIQKLQETLTKFVVQTYKPVPQSSLADRQPEVGPSIGPATDMQGAAAISLQQDQLFETFGGQGKNISKTAKKAMSGEFVDFCEYLDTEETNSLEPYKNNNGSISFRPKKTKKLIDSFESWLMAWSKHESILVESNPDLYPELSSYRQFIHRCSKKYYWNAVYIYDVRFRAKLGSSHSFDFGTIDSGLYVEVLDATAIKIGSKQCYPCKSFDHSVSSCPFPAETSLEENKFKKKTQVSKQNIIKWFHEKVEGCNNFQTETGCKYPGCKRAHVCRGCRGAEPQYKCPTCS